MARLVKDSKEHEVEFLKDADCVHIVFTNGEKASKVLAMFDEDEAHDFTVDGEPYEGMAVKTVALLCATETDFWEGTRVAVVLTEA